MGRNPINKSERRNRQIKVTLNNREFEMYNLHKERYLKSSPTLSVQDIFRKVALNIDDVALLQFLQLRVDDPLRLRLMYDYQMSLMANDDKT